MHRCGRHHHHHVCGCGEGAGGRHRHHGGSDCHRGWAGWEGPGFRRRFATREERIAELERYLDALRAEAQAVEEHIEELKRAGQE